jgi:hypothetical protein
MCSEVIQIHVHATALLTATSLGVQDDTWNGFTVLEQYRIKAADKQRVAFIVQ